MGCQLVSHIIFYFYLHDSELRIWRVRGHLTETLLPPVALVCFLFRRTMSMYLVSHAPAGAAGPRSFSESRLPEIFRLSHCIAVATGSR
jgi:hypothetical protein